MFVRRSLVLSGIGVSIGLVAAPTLTRLMSTLLYGITCGHRSTGLRWTVSPSQEGLNLKNDWIAVSIASGVVVSEQQCSRATVRVVTRASS